MLKSLDTEVTEDTEDTEDTKEIFSIVTPITRHSSLGLRVIPHPSSFERNVSSALPP